MQHMAMLDGWEIALRLALAALLGGVIGVNRQLHEWAAGLRTHMLVSVGAALAIIVSAFGFGDVLGAPNVVLDPSRIAAQVVSGIGFLGAGTILFMQREQVIRGLTTAAGLWAVACIGLAVGSGLYLAAVIATVLVWAILAILKPLERRMLLGRRHPRIILRLRGPGTLAHVESELRQRGLPLYKLVLNEDDGNQEVSLLFEKNITLEQMTAFVEALRGTEGVQPQRIDVASHR